MLPSARTNALSSRPLKLQPVQGVPRRAHQCQAVHVVHLLDTTPSLQALKHVASEEMVLESSLHVSSLTVLQCAVTYGFPLQAPALAEQHLFDPSTVQGSPVSSLLKSQDDRVADLAACLATPSTAESDESLEKHRIPIRQRAAVESEAIEMFAQESETTSEFTSRFVRSRRSLDGAGNALLTLTSMLPACPFTGRRLVSLLQA